MVSLKTIVHDKVPDKDYNMPQVIDLAVRNLESPQAEVRNAANELIFECFKKIGFERIEPMLSGKLT